MDEQNSIMAQQRHPGKLVRIGIVVLLGVLVSSLILSNVQQAAWSQGYALGLMAGADQSDALSQYLLYNNGFPGSRGPGFGAIFFVGLLFVGFLSFMRMTRMAMWRSRGGSDGAPWKQWSCTSHEENASTSESKAESKAESKVESKAETDSD
jgi:hypothetical protein